MIIGLNYGILSNKVMYTPRDPEQEIVRSGSDP